MNPLSVRPYVFVACPILSVNDFPRNVKLTKRSLGRLQISPLQRHDLMKRVIQSAKPSQRSWMKRFTYRTFFSMGKTKQRKELLKAYRTQNLPHLALPVLTTGFSIILSLVLENRPRSSNHAKIHFAQRLSLLRRNGSSRKGRMLLIFPRTILHKSLDYQRIAPNSSYESRALMP